MWFLASGKRNSKGKPGRDLKNVQLRDTGYSIKQMRDGDEGPLLSPSSI